jgi:hypothetical protein
MKQAVTVAILLCILAINVAGKPDQAPNKNEQGFEPKSPASLTSENNNITTHHTDHPNNEPPRWYAPLERSEWWLVIIAALTGIAIAYQAREMTRSTKEMKASTEISKKALVLTQRPQIVVRAFYFSEIRGVGGITHVSNRIEAGSFCTGQYYIENCGGTDARIREIYSEVFIADKLPMKRPYEGKEGSKEEKILRPGTSTFYLFGRMEPLDDSTAQALNVRREIIGAQPKSLYVLGWIGYTDDLGIYRITAFCRRYDIAKDRFVPVDDLDYEYAD